VRDSLLPWHEGTGDGATHRERMAYAALLSGITLAQVGLGSVHGLASPLGAFFPIPHGVVCGTLVGAATRGNIEALRRREPSGVALEKYARAGRLLTKRSELSQAEALQALLALLDDWQDRMELPRLGAYGVTRSDVPRVVAHSRGSSMKTNPLVLEDAEIAAVLESRI